MIELQNPWLRALFLLVLGLALFGFAASIIYTEYSALLTWKEVTGHVTSSNLTSYIHHYVDEDHHEHNTTMYRASIDYTYPSDGGSYAGHCCPLSSSNRNEQQAVVDKYPAGNDAVVIVNPANPAESKLKEATQPLNPFTIVLAAFGLLVLVLGVVELFRAFTRPLSP